MVRPDQGGTGPGTGPDGREEGLLQFEGEGITFEREQDGAEFGHQVVGVDLLGEGQGFLADLAGFGVEVEVGHRLHERGQRLGPRTAPLPLGEPDGLLCPLPRVGDLVVGEPGQHHVSRQQSGTARGVRCGVPDPVIEQGGGTVHVAGRSGGPGGKDGGVTAPRVVVVEPAESRLVEPRRLAVAAHGERRRSRLQACEDGAADITAGSGVPGALGSLGPLRVAGEGLGEGPVDPGSLAGEHVVQHRLGEQGVAEPVAVRRNQFQRLVVEGRAQGCVQLLTVQPGHRSEEVVTDAGARHSDHPHHALRGSVQLLEPGLEHAGQVGTDSGAAGHEFLCEEGVPAGPFCDRRHRFFVRGREGADEFPHRRLGQRVEVEPGDLGQSRPHGEGGLEGVPSVQVVGAVAHDHAEGRIETPGQQQGEDVTGGVVGPVDVFEHHQQRARPRDRDQAIMDGFCQPSGAGDAHHGRLGMLDGGQQQPERRMPGCGFRDLVGCLRPQDGEHLGERQVGHPGPGLSGAVADGDRDARVLCCGEEVAQQPGLADAGVAGQDREAVDGLRETDSLGERGQLTGAADQGRGLSPHGVDYRPWFSARRARHTSRLIRRADRERSGVMEAELSG